MSEMKTSVAFKSWISVNRLMNNPVQEYSVPSDLISCGSVEKRPKKLSEELKNLAFNVRTRIL